MKHELDIVPDLLKDIEGQFNQSYSNNPHIKRLYAAIDKGNVSTEDMYTYANIVGKTLGQSFDNHFTDERLPDGMMYYNIAERTIPPQLRKNHDLITSFCDKAQMVMNTKAKIGLKNAEPKPDEEAYKNLVQYVSDRRMEEVRKSFRDRVESLARIEVDNFVKENVDRHYKAGLHPKLIRRSDGMNPCKWCRELEGIYDYPHVPPNMYKRHNNCYCTIIYDPQDGSKKATYAWSKISFDRELIEKRKMYQGLEKKVYNPEDRKDK